MRVRAAFPALFPLLWACSSAPSSSSPAGVASSAEPATECAAGMRANAADASCVAVGTRAPAPGFQAREDSWGFAAIVARAPACPAGTRRALGQDGCVPIDDCARAFPPPEAEATVHDDASLQAALASAPSGATIALDEGVYGAVTLTKSVKLVGRCARKVVFQGTEQRGIYVQRELAIDLESLTVDGFQGGIVASYGPEVHARNVVVRNTTLGLVVGEAKMRFEGGVVEGHGAKGDGGVNATAAGSIEVVDSDVKNAMIYAAAPNSSIVVRHSVISRDTAVFRTGTLLQAWSGASLDVEDSAIDTGPAMLLDTGRDIDVPDLKTAAPPTVRIAGTAITATDRWLDDGLMRVRDGSKLTVDDTTIDHTTGIAIIVGDPESSLTMTDSLVRTPGGKNEQNAFLVTMGASADVKNSAFVGAAGTVGTIGHKGSRLVLEGSLVQGTTHAVVATKTDASGGSMALVVTDEASLAIANSTFAHNHEVAVAAANGARLDVKGTLFDDTLPADSGDWGNAVIGAENTELWIRESVFRKNADAAVSFMNASGIVEHSRFLANGVDLALEDTSYVESASSSDTMQSKTALFFANTFASGQPTKREGPNVVAVPEL